MKKIIGLFIFVFTICFSACINKATTITVGATATPHAEILEECVDYIKEKGYTLKIKVFTEYTLLNGAVNEGSLDANFFQHKPYLDNYNSINKTNLVGVFNVHFEPLGIYGGKSNTLEIPNKATIGIPNDESNRARALLLLDSLGIISLDSSKGLNVTLNDIIENPKEVQIIELSSENTALKLDDFNYCVINGNYAINAKVINRVLATELKDSIAATTYANLICVLEKNKDSEKTKILVEALNRQEISDFIKNKYNDEVVAAF